MNNIERENNNEDHRPLLESESEILDDWLRAIEMKNKTVTGQLMSLHDWEKGLKRARKQFRSKNK